MKISDNLKQLRLKYGMTQEELAEKIGVSRPFVTQLERGTKVLSVNLATEIAKVLDCKLEDLVKE